MISAKFSTNPPSFIEFGDGHWENWRKLAESPSTVYMQWPVTVKLF